MGFLSSGFWRGFLIRALQIVSERKSRIGNWSSSRFDTKLHSKIQIEPPIVGRTKITLQSCILSDDWIKIISRWRNESQTYSAHEHGGGRRFVVLWWLSSRRPRRRGLKAYRTTSPQPRQSWKTRVGGGSRAREKHRAHVWRRSSGRSHEPPQFRPLSRRLVVPPLQRRSCLTAGTAAPSRRPNSTTSGTSSSRCSATSCSYAPSPSPAAHAVAVVSDAGPQHGRNGSAPSPLQLGRFLWIEI
jgi:hypothetical protein